MRLRSATVAKSITIVPLLAPSDTLTRVLRRSPRRSAISSSGTSAAALHELESGRLRTVLSEAVWAAFRRTVELGAELEATVARDTAGVARDARGG